MSTPVSEIRDVLRREVASPGFTAVPLTSVQADSYIADAFWECRLMGVLSDYTITDGEDDAGKVIHKQHDSDEGLPEMFWQLLAIVAGMRILRQRMLDLAVNMSAKAGPVEYSRESSATALRAVFEEMRHRLMLLLELYSDELGVGGVVYFDSVLQREASLWSGALQVQIV